MILLHHDQSTESSRRINWWGESAKLKQAEALVTYYTDRAHRSVPDRYSAVDFIRTRKDEIDRMRLALWPYRGTDPRKTNRPRHPERWTDQNLLTDIRQADSLEDNTIAADHGMCLEEFYETEYRQMCWSIHGSGLVSVRGLPPDSFFLMCGLGYKWCGDLAMFCSMLVLDDFGFSNHLTELRTEWERIKGLGSLAYLNQLPPATDN